MILPTTSPQFRGVGLATGLEHRFRYVARLSNNAGGQNGNSWVVTSLPYLHYSEEMSEDMPQHVTLMGSGGAQWEWELEVGYRGLYGTKRTLFGGTYESAVVDPEGTKFMFYGHAANAAARGRLTSSFSAAGIITVIAYDSAYRIKSEVRTDPTTGDQAGLFYTFATSAPHDGRIFAVEKRLTISGVDAPIHRWLFTYHDGSDSAGSLNDLKTAEEQVWDSTQTEWTSAGKRYFRYYKASSSIGFTHGLRYVLDADSYARMSTLGLDPENVSQVTDAVLDDYAAEYFEYDSDKRHSKVVTRAGTQTRTIECLNSTGHVSRNWKRREIETRPDSSTLTTYFNYADRPVLKILESDGDTWPEYWEFNAESREIVHATSSAIASFTEPANASENFSVILNTDAGLIETKDYYPESGGGSGAAPGYLKEEAVKEGSSGTTVKQREYTYATRSTGGATIYKIANSIVYRESASGGSNPATTANAYTWQGSTFAVLQHTVTPPVVSTGENGTGTTATLVTVHDLYGNVSWRKNERGRIDYTVHDRLTGVLRFRIDDADTSTLEGFPSGWETASGFGSNRRTDCQSDLLGRAILVLGPAHFVATPNDEGAVEPVLTRRADFSLYLDGTREIRRARGGSTSGGLYTLGTATLRRLNYANQEIEVIEAARACPCGPLSSSEVFAQSSWRRWRREFFNAAAYRDESRLWHTIPASGEGFENINFYATRYGRDAMGRENRIAAPGGTITRKVIDARDLILSDWIGTNDIGATNDDPTGGSASGNNMVIVTTNVYDGGTDGGNGNLTSLIRPVDGTSDNDREVEFEYDFRDRLIEESSSDGTNIFLTTYLLNNLGQTSETDSYHSSIASGNLTARSTASFDARGRIYQNETFSVDPDTGTVGDALVGERWHDDGGNVIKETFPGSEGFVKRTYDAFNRVIDTYTACNSSGGSDNNNPASDIVVEQSEVGYDGGGNVVRLTTWQRFHDATGNGALNGPAGSQPKARRTYASRWHDALGREIASADYGTHGGTVLARPAVPPSRSKEVLVTHTRHASTGEPGAVIDPAGTETRWKRDALGREIETIENFREGAAPAADVNRTTRFAYHHAGGLETLTLVNNVTGDQTTRWVYGTTLTESGIATGNLLRAKIYPESDDASAPLGNGPDGVYERTEYAYNRQGETVSTKDPNETVHVYDRDKLGLLLHDRVTAFGTGIADEIKRISITYEAKRLLTATVSSHDHATPGSGSVLNEVGYTYDGFGQMTKDIQSHDGEIDPGTTPEVSYAYTSP